MSPRLRIEGIYDERTVKAINDMNIVDLSFDFRPRSFNFIQGYLFFDILKRYFNPEHRYFLHFQNDPTFTITKILADLSEFWDKEHDSINHNNVFLEFSDVQELAYYESFNHPFYWHYSEDNLSTAILKSPLMKGVVFNQAFLEKKHNDGNLLTFVQNFLQKYHFLFSERQTEFFITLDCGQQVIPSIFDIFDFDGLSLSINNEIEVCYRNIDMNKFSQHINFYRSLNI